MADMWNSFNALDNGQKILIILVFLGILALTVLAITWMLSVFTRRNRTGSIQPAGQQPAWRNPTTTQTLTALALGIVIFLVLAYFSLWLITGLLNVQFNSLWNAYWHKDWVHMLLIALAIMCSGWIALSLAQMVYNYWNNDNHRVPLLGWIGAIVTGILSFLISLYFLVPFADNLGAPSNPIQGPVGGNPTATPVSVSNPNPTPTIVASTTAAVATTANAGNPPTTPTVSSGGGTGANGQCGRNGSNNDDINVNGYSPCQTADINRVIDILNNSGPDPRTGAIAKLDHLFESYPQAAAGYQFRENIPAKISGAKPAQRLMWGSMDGLSASMKSKAMPLICNYTNPCIYLITDGDPFEVGDSGRGILLSRPLDPAKDVTWWGKR